jgi:Mg/Co/Ni transporter MgtE (contains CBS domain)
VWLLFLFVAGSITANVLRLFEAELEQVVALSFFIPLLIGTGGNTGAQTVSTLIRAMALNEVRLRDVWRVLARELLVGVILGFLLAIIAFGRAFLEVPMASLAITVALSVMAICIWANIIGAMVPMAARRFGIDPALISAPLITTLVDASGLAIYLLIAKALLGL